MNNPQSLPRANRTGMVWMVASMAAFALEDAFIKATTKQLPVGQVLMLFGAGGTLLFACLSLRNGSSLLNAQVASKVMLLRAFCELTGRLFYVLAIALTPMSSATAILQATPLLVVLGATVFFGETVGWRRWCAILVGLIGVGIILRPAAGDFSALSLLAVVGTLGFAGRDLASRAAPASLSTWLLGFYGFMTVVVAGALFSWWDDKAWVWPTAAQLMSLAAAIGAGVFAYTALMKAMRTGSISAVTPFRYTRLVFGVALGIVMFSERMDGPMVLGCLVVIGSGLFIGWQGKVREK